MKYTSFQPIGWLVKCNHALKHSHTHTTYPRSQFQGQLVQIQSWNRYPPIQSLQRWFWSQRCTCSLKDNRDVKMWKPWTYSNRKWQWRQKNDKEKSAKDEWGQSCSVCRQLQEIHRATSIHSSFRNVCRSSTTFPQMILKFFREERVDTGSGPSCGIAAPFHQRQIMNKQIV